ncbi:MAG: hypothetical protein ACHQM6_03210, partial [Candidatus Kapaibacterium sp.]
YSVPLVILILSFWGIRLNAQELAHSSLMPYFDKLPSAPVFPDNSALTSDKPEAFEEHADLDAIEKKLEPMLRITYPEGAQISNVLLNEKAIANPAAHLTLKDESPEMQNVYNILHKSLKNMQEMKIDYAANFLRLENVYFKKISDYYKEGHTAENNTTIISATRDKITGEEYLLSVYIARVREDFKQVDNLLADNNYGEGAKSDDVKNLFRGAEADEALLLHDIIERIKLERITISNSARLAQEGAKGK